MTNRPRWRAVLDTVAVIAFIAACVSVAIAAWQRVDSSSIPTDSRGPAPPEPPLPSEPLDVFDSPMLGQPGAKVALVLYSDIECPFCRRFALETLPTVRRELVDTGRLLLVFKHVPLAIHPRAVELARAAECAREEGKFWEMHDLLFGAARPLATDAPLIAARKLGLRLDAFDSCRNGSAVVATLERDAASARAAGVRGTPTLLLGVLSADGRVTARVRLKGVQSSAAIAAAVEDLER